MESLRETYDIELGVHIDTVFVNLSTFVKNFGHKGGLCNNDCLQQFYWHQENSMQGLTAAT